MLGIFAPVLLSAALGWLALRLFVRPNGAWLAPAFYLAFGFPLGAAMFGVFSFLAFLLAPPGRGAFEAAICTPAAMALCAAWLQARSLLFVPLPLHIDARRGRVLTILGLVCLGTAIAAALLLVEFYAASPHGYWDAFEMWNARARVLHRAPLAWRNVFLSDNFHPDYPLTLSILVDAGWSRLGSEAPAVPFALAAAFLIAAAAAVALGVALWKGPAWGTAAAIVILSAGGYVSLAGWQYADVPLSALLAVTLVLFTLAYHGGAVRGPVLAVAGASAALCAWIKNEGMPLAFGLTLGLALGCVVLRQGRSWARHAGFFWLGAAPVLAILVYRRSFTPVNDVLSGALDRSVLQKLADAHRWTSIAGRYGEAWWRTPGTAVPLLLIVMVTWVLAGVRVEPRLRLPLIASACGLASLAAAHFAAYLVTPEDLTWHLNTSVSRLVLQLMPSLVFVALLLVRSDFLQPQENPK